MTVVRVIWGPPASGKTTYVNDRKGTNDLIYDFDRLLEDLSGRSLYDHNDNLIGYLVEFREAIINRLTEEQKLDTAWLIVSFPSDELRAQLDELGAEYTLMDTDKETCRQRIEADEMREDKAEWLRVLDEWFAKYEQQQTMNRARGVIPMAKQRFWQIRAAADKPKTGEVLLYGIISSTSWWGDEVTPKQFADDLKALGDIETLNVYINSDGGDVFAGQAIHSMLKRHPANVVVHVDGLAASIASVIAMAGDRVIMPRNAMMMVHNPWTIAMGNADDFRKMADDLDQIRESIVAAYQAKTGMEREDIIPLLDAETWLTAEEALSMGFADEIEETKQVAASLSASGLVMNGQEFDLSRFRHPPKVIVAQLPKPEPADVTNEIRRLEIEAKRFIIPRS